MVERSMVEHGSVAPVGRPRVVAAAVEGARRGNVIIDVNRVVAGGGSALLITADGGGRTDGEELDPRVETLDLSAVERSLGVHALLSRDPSRLLHRWRGTTAPPGPSPAWFFWSTCRPYRAIRPFMLWRALRHRLDVVRVGEVDHVLLVHPNSWPIAWQLHRLNPAIEIAYDVPAELWERYGRPVPELLS
jgi:hypothetical protein